MAGRAASAAVNSSLAISSKRCLRARGRQLREPQRSSHPCALRATPAPRAAARPTMADDARATRRLPQQGAPPGLIPTKAPQGERGEEHDAQWTPLHRRARSPDDREIVEAIPLAAQKAGESDVQREGRQGRRHAGRPRQGARDADRLERRRQGAARREAQARQDHRVGAPRRASNAAPAARRASPLTPRFSSPQLEKGMRGRRLGRPLYTNYWPGTRRFCRRRRPRRRHRRRRPRARPHDRRARGRRRGG